MIGTANIQSSIVRAVSHCLLFMARAVDIRSGLGALTVFLFCATFSSGVVASDRADKSGRANRADMVVYNGKILTVDNNFSIAQAAAIRDGKFIAVGSNGDALQHARAGTQRINLQGKTVVPGLIDAHAHMDREGLRDTNPSLAGATTKAEILAIIKAEVDKAGPGEWIVTAPLGTPPFHFEARDILERTGLNRYDLDEVAPNNPVYIRSIWGFWDRPPLVAIANSQALQIAGVDAGTQPPYEGIEIVKDASGQPTGVFFESNSQPALEHSLFKMVPRFTHDIRVAALRESMRIYNSFGTTSVYEGHGVASEVIAAYKELWTKGEMTVRANLVLSPTPGWFEDPVRPEFELFLRDWATYAGDEGFGDEFLRFNGLFFQAGGDPDLAAILAAEAPYTAWAGYYYDAPPSTEIFSRVAMMAAKYDLRLHAIAGGGAGLDTALAVYEEVNQTYPIDERRWVIEHVSDNTSTQIDRMVDLGIVPTAIPPSTVWKRSTPPPPDIENFAPYKSLLRAGLKLALATDNVPANPFFTMWTTIARENRNFGGPIGPAERLSRREALRAMTINGAYLSFEEDVKGSIEVGKYGDLVVLDRDYLEVPRDQIKDIEALTTIVGGKVVYQRDAEPPQ